MTQENGNPPVVMILSGLDPSGGAGLQADIETIASMGCHAAPLVTALTVQDTTTVHTCRSVDPMLLIEQIRAVLEDIPVAACKIGLIADTRIAEVIHSVFVDYPDIPLILDPVLASGNGTPLSDAAVLDAVKSLLLPLTTVLTPNSIEARRLAPEADTLDAAAQVLLSCGAEFVLITGTHEPGKQVTNTLYGGMRRLETFYWERLPHEYHGSGCTLSSAISGLIAQGGEPITAIHEAQQYTWESLQRGYRIGMGQYIPNRLFWSRCGST